jgi:hypothetical protein
MKNSSNTIGNRTRELPACSIAPQATTPPRNPHKCKKEINNNNNNNNNTH